MYAIPSTLIDLNSIPQAASSLEQAILTFQRWQEGGGFEGEGERIHSGSQNNSTEIATTNRN